MLNHHIRGSFSNHTNLTFSAILPMLNETEQNRHKVQYKSSTKSTPDINLTAGALISLKPGRELTKIKISTRIEPDIAIIYAINER